MIRLENIYLSYKDKVLIRDGKIEANRGEIVFIEGKSGCGKTTLLYELCLLGKRNCKYYWDFERIDQLSLDQKAKIRRNKISYVIQDRIINSHLTVTENIRYFAKINGTDMCEKEAENLLNNLNIGYLKDKDMSSLSGGEWQRIAVSCAVAKKPDLLLMDEPTSQLDDENEKILMNWIRKIAKKENICVIMTTHKDLEEYADRVYYIQNKELVLKKQNPVNYTSSTDRKENKISIFDSVFFSLKNDPLKYIKLFFMLMTVPLFISVLDAGIDHYYQEQINICEDSAQKEIYYDKNNKKYITLNNEIKARLLFYYPQNQMSRYLQQDYRQKGCYISQSLIKYYSKDLRNTQIQLIYNHNKINLNIGGIVYKDEIINGLSDEYYIYVSIDDYQYLTNEKPVFFVESLDKMIKYSPSQIVFLEDVQICDYYQKILGYKKMMVMLVKSIFIILSILLSIIYCYYKRKEWTFRILEGFNKLSLIFIIAIENFSALLLMSLIIYLLSKNLCILFFQYSFILCTIIITISFIFLNKIDFIKVIRN